MAAFIETVIVAAVVALGIIWVGKAIITGRAISRRRPIIYRLIRALHQCRQPLMFSRLGEGRSNHA